MRWRELLETDCDESHFTIMQLLQMDMGSKTRQIIIERIMNQADKNIPDKVLENIRFHMKDCMHNIFEI